MALYLLSTPIGCLDDISFRFLQTVSTLDNLFVEDTRKSAKLLQLLQTKWSNYCLWPKKLILCNRQKERQAAQEAIVLLKKNVSVGLLSDAGTPAISDPGAYLVNEVRAQGLVVEAVPGPSALTTCLSLSGFTAQVSLFFGFLPKKPNSYLAKLLEKLAPQQTKSFNLVFFESPLRIRKTASLLFKQFPQSRLFIGRELTKKFEEQFLFTAKSFKATLLKPKGEYTGVLNIKML